MGLWVALVIGYSVTASLAMFAVYRSDWDDLAKKAVLRSEGGATQLEETTALLPSSDAGDTPQYGAAGMNDGEGTIQVDVAAAGNGEDSQPLLDN